jgi:hypothetical protein
MNILYIYKKISDKYNILIEIKKDLEEHQIKNHDLININLENILKVDYQDYDKYNKTDSNILIFDTNNNFTNNLDIILKYMPQKIKIYIENILKENPIYLNNIININVEYKKIPFLKLFNKDKIIIKEYGIVDDINEFIKNGNRLEIEGYLHKIYRIYNNNSDIPIYIKYNII